MNKKTQKEETVQEGLVKLSKELKVNFGKVLVAAQPFYKQKLTTKQVLEKTKEVLTAKK